MDNHSYTVTVLYGWTPLQAGLYHEKSFNYSWKLDDFSRGIQTVTTLKIGTTQLQVSKKLHVSKPSETTS